MNLDSKYFDCIRVKPQEDRLRARNLPRCHWQGCDRPAEHRAPMGRGREGQYFNFCLDHVREYNKSYNYFDGMSDEEVASYLRSSVTGHRPTWSMGARGAHAHGGAGGAEPPGGFMHGFSVEDLFGFFGGATVAGEPRGYEGARPIRKAEHKCLLALGLDETATAQQIKSRYKMLVKRHHPDHNQGDRRSEDKLREVIQAYTYLKQAGLC